MARPIALITGASSGIGERIALRLASSGHDLVLVARRTEELNRVAAEAVALGATCETMVADLSQRDDLARIESRILQAERPIEIVVNNAGYGRFGKIRDLDGAGEANEIDLNITALTLLSRAALVAMAPRRHGGILNVASLASFIPFPGFTTYAATKAYVRHFTLALHEEAKPFGVRVTCVAPGFTPTGFQERGGLSQTSGVPRFLLTSADSVARIALEALRDGRALVVPGWINALSARFLSLMPSFLLRRMGAIGARVPR
jgi:short-subunit dehydrogenase